MSYGIVMCSVCRRELHQDGNADIANGWRHCDSKTPMCPGGNAIYPDSTADIVGEWCGRDAGPDTDAFAEVRPKRSVAFHFGAMAAVALAAAPAFGMRRARIPVARVFDHPCFQSSGPLPPLPGKPKCRNRPPGWKRRQRKGRAS